MTDTNIIDGNIFMNQTAFVDGRAYSGEDCSLDLTGADDVEIMISPCGTKIWVNTPECRLRICQIRGKIVVNDMREATPFPEPSYVSPDGGP